MSTAAQRTAIIELLEGDIGTIFTVAANTFAFGVFEGQPDGAQRALATDRATATHRFDVEFGEVVDHEATPLSAKASTRIVRVAVAIPVWTKTATTIEETARRELLASIEGDCDTAIRALSFPGNLTQTSGSVATDIAGGFMTAAGGQGAPTWSLEFADWDRNIIKSRIDGEITVSITQPVS